MNADDLTVQVIEARDDQGLTSATLNIRNEGSGALDNHWRLYFSLGLKPLIDEHLPDAAPVLQSTLIEGRYGYLSPGDGYEPLNPGDTLSIGIENWLFNGMPARATQGFHVTFLSTDGDQQKETEPEPPCVLPPILNPLDQLENAWIRDMSPSCDAEPASPEHLWQKQQSATRVLETTLIPRPKQLSLSGDFVIEGGIDQYPLEVSIDTSLGAEAFTLQTFDTGGKIRAGSQAGAYYARQALRQLATSDGDSTRVPIVELVDEPDFEHRAVFLDIARHFQPLAAIKRLVLAMASYRLNRLQLGISNDEGWRLEMPAMQTLAKVGARRGFHANESDGKPRGLYPAWGDDHVERLEYLTTEEFEELLAFAAEHQVEIIPEVNLPGHANAVIRAAITDGRFTLLDPLDTSNHRSAQGYTRNVANVALDDTYELATLIFRDILHRYQTAGVPFKRIHLGGDEVPEGAWLHSPACHQAEFWNDSWDMNIEDHRQAATAACNGYYARRILTCIRSVVPDIEVGFWHEMSPHLPDDPNITVNAWLTESAEQRVIADILRRGQRLVISNASFLYLDMPYALHEEEPGLPWAAYIETDTIYDFSPLQNWGIATGAETVAGLQAQLWSETIYNAELMEFHYFPRLLAVAERAWNGQPETSDWNSFATALGERELPHLIGLGVTPRIPPPGVINENGKLQANAQLPGLEIHYELVRRGSNNPVNPSAESPKYTDPIQISEPNDIVEARFICLCEGLASRVVSVRLLPEDPS